MLRIGKMVEWMDFHPDRKYLPQGLYLQSSILWVWVILRIASTILKKNEYKILADLPVFEIVFTITIVGTVPLSVWLGYVT